MLRDTSLTDYLPHMCSPYSQVRSIGWTGQEPYLEFAAETAGECLYQMGKISKVKFSMEKCGM